MADEKENKIANNKLMDNIESALSKLNGQPTGIKAEADVERIVMGMAGVPNVTPTSPASVGTKRIGDSEVMTIKGMNEKDLKTFVDNLNNTYGQGTAEIASQEGDTTKVRIPIAKMETIVAGNDKAPSMRDYAEKLGNTDQGAALIRELQKQSNSKEAPFKSSKEQAMNAVQNEKTTPAAPVKAGGLVEGATITTLGSFVSSPDGKGAEQIRGTADFIIKRNKDGKMIAELPESGGQRLVAKPEAGKETANQEITATLKIDGQAPKQIKLEVAKDGTLTEKSAPPIPQGKSQGTQMR